MNVESSNPGSEPTYRSGTAARLAGIPVDTLRTWERRYQVVGPQVSAHGHRRYAAEDVDRLALIKALINLGHSIGTLAHLPATKLHELHAGLVALPSATQPRTRESSVVRVAIVGESAGGAGCSGRGAIPATADFWVLT